MSTGVTLFHFDEGQESFEDLGKPNGATHWDDEILRASLGYESHQAFDNVVLRAKQACLSLGIQLEDHFTLHHDGSRSLTRFGCYLVAMNGDPRKSQVAAAQAYFAALAETFQSHLEHSEGIERILIRDEIKDGQKSLASTAKRHRVENYAFFQNKGYMGMYNMNLDKLSYVKGVKKKDLVDRMGKEEMAAHLFRITQTDAKIRNESIYGQKDLEEAAFVVGRNVRKVMIESSGSLPESLPPSEHVNSVRKKLKGSSKKLKAIDKK
ncbi:MAG: damage-inducible protein D [Planctomycetaceae bacterium]